MRLKDVIVGAAMTAAGAAYLRMAQLLPEKDGVDAATVPTFLAWLMILLGLIELAGALRRAPDDAARAPTGGVLTVALTLALIAGYVAALRPLGFPIATALYLFVQFLVLTPRSIRPPVPLYAGLAVAAAAVIFATFRYGFDLLLPSGPLVAWLN
ncbi:tripartite tricarboxylate transporter TctB family protein [Paracoccus spongiarum]|uniref:Tripartite tricarboxylate transporter TctB family protein n=1 Tax=Paracoccus spongiarum TaxID=3064387 RepID=A0ABT9JAR1_9RHOB|nr:tripartite tricarboxylate transporter TctB family protein [Paracoccus sp. 2205BS29-5]MDP5306815.1 tripartite tricarboxylate transporter TctB family protein [Paracoccus sp. 2205BS29-5]